MARSHWNQRRHGDRGGREEKRKVHSREAETKVLRSPGFLKPEALVRYLAKMDLITQHAYSSHTKTGMGKK